MTIDEWLERIVLSGRSSVVQFEPPDMRELAARLGALLHELARHRAEVLAQREQIKDLDTDLNDARKRIATLKTEVNRLRYK